MRLQWQNGEKPMRKIIHKLKDLNAVGEAFGYYFNETW